MSKSKRGRSYTEEFREDAVQLLLSSGRPLSQVARELDVNINTLTKWRDKSLNQSGSSSLVASSGQAAAGASVEALADEIKRLKKENEYLRRQRDILKKAASILSEDPKISMR